MDKVVLLHLIYLRYAMLHSGRERCVDRIAPSRAARESGLGMDAKQAAELLHGLPLSNCIVARVFQEAERWYSAKYPRPNMDGDLLPLPDRLLTEQEWLTLFWTLDGTQPSHRNRQPISDDFPLERLRFRLLTSLSLVPDRQAQNGWMLFKVDPRFNDEGRSVVIETLCREGLRRSLQHGELTKQIQLGLIGTDSDSARPKYLGADWHCPHFPITETREAIAVWLACTHRMMERWKQSFVGVDRSQPRNDEVSRLMACWVYDDARSLSECLGVSSEPHSDPSDFSEVFQYLRRLRQEISNPSNGQSGKKPKSGSNAGMSCQLVTIQQVATIVHLESKSMTKYVRDWGEPAVLHSGQRPAKYDLTVIRTTLKTQFPKTNDDAWNRLETSATPQ